jgi:hypothetical protein
MRSGFESEFRMAAGSRASLPVMPDKKSEPTQKTQPKKGEPVEIPVPTSRDVLDLMKRVSGRRSQGDKPRENES